MSTLAGPAMLKITILFPTILIITTVITITKIIMIMIIHHLKLEWYSKEANEHISSGEVGDEQVGRLAVQTPDFLMNMFHVHLFLYFYS